MDIFSLEFVTSLLLIVGIDLVLAGDNAIVIGLAARKLPKQQQKKAVIWGTVGAVVIRMVAAMILVTLLKIPGLHLVGGLLLIWIAYKLITDNQQHDENVEASPSLWGAVRTIVIADALMGLDNVLAISGAAHDSYLLVGLGLLISVPIVMWGSTLFIKLIEKFPWVIYVGGAILAYTAGHMVTGEKFLDDVFSSEILSWGFMLLVILIVLAAGFYRNLYIATLKKQHNIQG
ncbi:YjbE family integral membrane protein [Pullulanibacillus pueri]|uniref:Membrane protein n=1 Tax=Pullulanibacillus pueri TaxID=1437324 RepID=A0A8J2ZYQ6_9BACL|nr:TerC family protein [Pullulanibacillus pueri]MBM7683189.1 YjbE family integral membrane protein [Pullulanibacillus pueri]GGH85624.1 membrane protein [Pullulanibacillus pueri]